MEVRRGVTFDHRDLPPAVGEINVADVQPELAFEGFYEGARLDRLRVQVLFCCGPNAFKVETIAALGDLATPATALSNRTPLSVVKIKRSTIVEDA